MKNNTDKKKLKPLQKYSLFFFNRPRKTALLFLILAVLGALSYSTFLKREGFPKYHLLLIMVHILLAMPKKSTKKLLNHLATLS